MICHCPSYHALVNALIWLSQIKGFFASSFFPAQKRIFPRKESLNDLNLFTTTETFNIRIENSFKQFPLRVLLVSGMRFVFRLVGFFFFSKVTFCLIFSKGFE
jgi:hypothetical protein